MARSLDPLVSVVIPLYNAEGEIERALASVLAQTEPGFEAVVVDDGSTDAGSERVSAISDPRVRLVRQANAGVAAARNRGIREARADTVAFLDADDEWLPDFLATVLAMRRELPDCDVFATSYFVHPVGEARRPAIVRGVAARTSPFRFDDYFEVASRSEPPIWSSAVAATKRALTAVGGFPEDVRAGEDLLTWARLMSRYRCAYLSEPKAVFHVKARPDGLPTRVPASDDVVGRELLALVAGARGRRRVAIRRYVAMWHRMRASMLLRLGDATSARRDIAMGLRTWPAAGKLWAYGALSLSPGPLRRRLLGVAAGREK